MALPSIEIETAPNPRHAVIWLHGLGADGHDFEPIVPELVDRVWPALRFVFPNAPVRPITINGGMSMRAWYDISGMEIAQRQDETGMRASIGLLDELIAREVARGVPGANIFLAAHFCDKSTAGTQRSENPLQYEFRLMNPMQRRVREHRVELTLK